MNWKPGDIAICVKTGKLTSKLNYNPPEVRLHAEYVVQNVYQCPKCKAVALDVGLPGRSSNGTTCFCGELIPCKDIWWCGSERFVKKDLRRKEEQIEEAIANEDYELASKLSA